MGLRKKKLGLKYSISCRLHFIMTLGIMGLFLSGCEKKIDFKLKDQEPKLVVEATIENGQAPVVRLMKSVGYFSKITPDILLNSFVHNASVFVSNGILIHKLKEYAVSVGNGITLYYYSIDSSNQTTAFTGQLKHQYSLRILADGKEYTASRLISGYRSLHFDRSA